MDAFIATPLDDFAHGKISRRKLIETLTLAITALCATEDAASADPALKVALVNHVSYTCPNFKEAADWYSKVFNLDQVGATAKRCRAPVRVRRADQRLRQQCADLTAKRNAFRKFGVPGKSAGI
jgi:hypothetical protein